MRIKRFRKFNEDNNIPDIEYYTKSYLSYLLDNDDFEINVTSISPDPSIWLLKIKLEYNVRKDTVWGSEGFSWQDIKDHYIPFLQHLKKDIGIVGYDDEGITDNRFNDDYTISIVFFDNPKGVRNKGNKGRGREKMRPYYKLVKLEDLETLELNDIWYVSVYVKEYDDEE